MHNFDEDKHFCQSSDNNSTCTKLHVRVMFSKALGQLMILSSSIDALNNVKSHIIYPSWITQKNLCNLINAIAINRVLMKFSRVHA